jgi:hypothetical protein
MASTIGDWTPEILTKWIRDLFQNQPPDFLPNLKVEDIQVDKNLIIRERVRVVTEPAFREIGKPGSPVFANSWVNFAAGWQVAAFNRDPFGWVSLRGLIKSGTVGNAAFTLPPGYRPPVSETFGVNSNGAFGRVDVQADGQVIPQAPSNNTYVSLSGIRFRVT